MDRWQSNRNPNSLTIQALFLYMSRGMLTFKVFHVFLTWKFLLCCNREIFPILVHENHEKIFQSGQDAIYFHNRALFRNNISQFKQKQIPLPSTTAPSTMISIRHTTLLAVRTVCTLVTYFMQIQFNTTNVAVNQNHNDDTQLSFKEAWSRFFSSNFTFLILIFTGMMLN